MSFLSELAQVATQLGHEMPEDTSPQQAVDAAKQHVSQMDDDTLGDHLQNSVAQMDTSNVAKLGQALLHAFEQNGTAPADAANDAGVPTSAVKNGSPDAVQSLIDVARQNQGLLQQAASAFVQHNPGALSQLAPSLLKGVLSQLSNRS